jgi:hypothetical protein
MVGKPSVVDPRHLGVLAQVGGNLVGVAADAVHAQRQRLETLQDQEAVHRRDGCAHVAQRHDARAADEGGRSERFGIDDAVVGDVGFVEALELQLVLGPGETSAVDDHAADRVAVAADVLGQRVHDDVGPMLEGAAQIGRGNRVVDDQRHAMAVRDLGQRLEVGDVAERVADRFAVQRLGPAVDQPFETRRIGVVGEADVDAILRQGVREQVVGAAIERRRGNDVVSGFGDGHDGVGDRRLSRGQRQSADAALHCRHPLSRARPGSGS